jgi:hypothetical protein
VPFPNPATQFKVGNPGKLKGTRPMSDQRARKLAKEAIFAAEVARITRQPPDFNGDAHEYLQAIYRGEIAADQAQRMQAASKAVGYEKPALAAVAVAQKAEASLVDLLARIGRNQDSAPALMRTGRRLSSKQR